MIRAIQTILIIAVFLMAAAGIRISVLLAHRHEAAVRQLAELKKQHKAPDSTLLEILHADTLYMEHGGR